nr:hypothetical protein [Dictyobacter kobayashii]
MLTEKIDGCEAHLTLTATGRVARETIQPNRGWSDDEWSAAQERLTQRGWLDDSGALTNEGQHGRSRIEQLTDDLALTPWQSLGENNFARLLSLMRTISTKIVEQKGVPSPNPIGSPTRVANPGLTTD